MEMLKGKTAIKLFKSYPDLKRKPYWGNHFWSRGYCVSTIGLDENKIRKYVKYQEERERQEEGDQQDFGLFLKATCSAGGFFTGFISGMFFRCRTSIIVGGTYFWFL
jgi:hypothetical protein